MSGDLAVRLSYSQLMREQPVHISLTLDLREPAELGDFVSAFTSLANQYEKYLKATHPDLAGEAQIFVKEVRPGSIIAELIPMITGGLPSVITTMDQLVIVADFVKIYGERLWAYLGGNRLEGASKSDLVEFMGQVASIARDPNATSTIEAVYFEDGKRKVKAAVKFNTKDADKAVKAIEKHREDLNKTGRADHERKFMTFKRSDKDDATIGKRSGERVIIADLSDRDLPLAYASNLAEERIKHEIRESVIYKKGFVVDVNVETRGGKPVAYSVTHVHQVIDLDD